MPEKKQSIAKSAVLVTTMMLGFKIIGFIKQAVVAYYYGATQETDIYFIAWGLVSGVSEAVVKALSVSIVAIYTSLRVKKGKEEAARLVNGLVEILFPIFLLMVCVILFSASLFAGILAPSYDAEERVLLARYIRILAPVLLFGSLELIFGAVLDSYKSFFIPRLQSFIYSMATILCCVTLSGRIGVTGLVAAQYASNVLFTILLITSVRRYHRFFLVKIRELSELKNILNTALPLFIGNSALQINQIVDKSITSGLGQGATSALSYCHTLEQFVTNIMIVNIGNVMFANFAEFVAQKEYEQIGKTLKTALNVLICVLLAVSIITVICAEDIVSIVYHRGSFSAEAVVLTACALTGYALSFVAVAVRDLSIKSMYAFKDTRHPMLASLVSILINIVFSLTLSRFLGIFGVSLATSISAFVGMMINAHFLKKYLTDYRYTDHLIFFFKILPAGIVVAVVTWCMHRYVPLGHLWMFLLICVVGFTCYFGQLYLMRITEVRIFTDMVRKKIKSKKGESYEYKD